MRRFFKKFFSSASIGGIILSMCVIISLVVANSPLGASFEYLLNYAVGPQTSSLHLRYPVAMWINDGLMAVFFLLVGLELKREMMEGELSTPRHAVLPVACAAGGALVPTAIYLAVNYGTATVTGWGIPMATDIAFALAVLASLGRRAPASLKIFLTALAIVDDLLAILVIAIFYSGQLHLLYLAYAAGILLLLLAFNRLGVRSLVAYLVPGLFMWYFIHHSGIHATIAGVATAMTIPFSTPAKTSPLLKLEHALTTPVNFLIVPVFALANTNIRIEPSMVNGLFSPLGIGIILGLCAGKPLGILFMSRLVTWMKIASLPAATSWRHIAGAGLLAGIGFTMSMFIALLSFTDALVIAKFSILVASLLSGILGYLLIKTGKTEHAVKKHLNDRPPNEKYC